MTGKLATIVLLFAGLILHKSSGERAVDCQKRNILCHERATCVTLDAASDQHTCRCNEGFQGDGLACEDINECKLEVCPPDTRCWNQEGGYQCFQVSMNAAQHSSPIGFSVILALGFIFPILLAQ